MSRSRLKIAYVMARGDAFGGASRHVCDLAGRLMDDGHTVRVFVGGSGEMEVPRRLAARNLDFRCIPEMQRSISPLKDASACRKLRRELRRFSPQLVSAHASKAGVLGRLACAGMSVPVLYSPHCWSFAEGFPNAGMYVWVERMLAPLATCIVTVCEQERQYGIARRVGNEQKTVCIHNGVKDISSHEKRSHSNAGNEPPRILMVARFEEQKDHRLLLTSLGEIRDLDWRLTLVGDGPQKQSCQQLAQDCGIDSRVDFAGYSDRVGTHLEQADIFALISHWEGFPRSILEAMRARLPVIVSDVGGCREAVRDRQSGRVVQHGNKKQLAGALRELVGDPKRRAAMGALGRRLFEEKFTFERMYSSYADLYRVLCTR